MTTILDQINYNDIFNKIMLVLLANEGILYNQYKLYSIVLDKFTNYQDSFVPMNFKYKFFIVIRELMLKDDIIQVYKENNIYHIIYNAPYNIKLEKINYIPDWIDKTKLNNFIIDNKIDMNYQDPETGNTIYHDILSESNNENLKKILEFNNINYNIKNYNNQTPVECIKDITTAVIIVNDLSNKLYETEKKLNNIHELVNKIEYENIVNQFEFKNRLIELELQYQNKNKIIKEYSIIYFIKNSFYIILVIILILIISKLFYKLYYYGII